MAEILIVDDERVVREGLRQTLLGEGYAVRTARDGEDALRKIGEARPDAVLLDVMMPKMNGFRCCEEIRKADALLPVVFLTAKDSEADQIRGLGLGGDSYVSKASSEALLLTCVRRVIERTRKARESLPADDGQVVRLGAVTVNAKSFVVSDGEKEVARLTRTEMDLLLFLNAHRGEYFVIDDLITELRGNGFACEDAMVYSHVSKLRAKLGRAGSMISMMRGAGYCLLK